MLYFVSKGNVTRAHTQKQQKMGACEKRLSI